MQKIGVLFICLGLLLTGCSDKEIISIYGQINRIEENTFFVECSDAVNKDKGYSTDVGYSCLVQITDETKFKNQIGENLSKEDFSKSNTVQVIFTEPKTLDSSESSREVEAKEIILND